MSFADLAADMTDACFDQLGDAAEYLRAGGQSINTRAALVRAYQQEGHIGQRRLTALLPLADVLRVERDDQLNVEGRTFIVTQEVSRDQNVIEVLLRERT